MRLGKRKEGWKWPTFGHLDLKKDETRPLKRAVYHWTSWQKPLSLGRMIIILAVSRLQDTIQIALLRWSNICLQTFCLHFRSELCEVSWPWPLTFASCDLYDFMPPPPTICGERHYVFRSSVRLSVSQLTRNLRDAICPSCWHKLDTNIHHVSGHCSKWS